MSDTPTGRELELKSGPTIREVIDRLKAENTYLREQLTARTQEVERLRERVKELEEEMRDNPDI